MLKLEWYKPLAELVSHLFKGNEVVSICSEKNHEKGVWCKNPNPKYKCESCLKKKEQLDWLNSTYHL